jgi:hypothetical protein
VDVKTIDAGTLVTVNQKITSIEEWGEVTGYEGDET